MREVLVVHGLGDIDIAAEIIAALNLYRVVRGGEHHHRAAFEVFVFFQPLEDGDPAHVRQVQIEQNQQRIAFVFCAGPVGPEQEFDRVRTVGKRANEIVHAGAADVLFDQAGVPFVILDHDDGDGLFGHPGVHATLLFSPIQRRGSVTVKTLPLPSSDVRLMVPPRRRTSARTWASPMPSPGRSWGPERRKSSKTR